MEQLIPEAAKVQTDRLFAVRSSLDQRDLDKKVPAHVNILSAMGQEPAYPYDASMKEDNPCYTTNHDYLQCLNADKVVAFAMHERVCACYEDKIALQKCLAKQKRVAKAAATS